MSSTACLLATAALAGLVSGCSGDGVCWAQGEAIDCDFSISPGSGDSSDSVLPPDVSAGSPWISQLGKQLVVTSIEYRNDELPRLQGRTLDGPAHTWTIAPGQSPNYAIAGDEHGAVLAWVDFARRCCEDEDADELVIRVLSEDGVASHTTVLSGPIQSLPDVTVAGKRGFIAWIDGDSHLMLAQIDREDGRLIDPGSRLELGESDRSWGALALASGENEALLVAGYRWGIGQVVATRLSAQGVEDPEGILIADRVGEWSLARTTARDRYLIRTRQTPEGAEQADQWMLEAADDHFIGPDSSIEVRPSPLPGEFKALAGDGERFLAVGLVDNGALGCAVVDPLATTPSTLIELDEWMTPFSVRAGGLVGGGGFAVAWAEGRSVAVHRLTSSGELVTETPIAIPD